MKILVLYQSPWWNAASYYTFCLVKSLTNLGYEVIFAGAANTPTGKRIKDDSCRILDINLFENKPHIFYNNIIKVRDLVISENIDYLIPISAPGHIIVGINKLFSKIKLPIIKVCLDNVSPVKNFLNKYLHNKLTDYFIFPGQSTKIKYAAFDIIKYSILHAPIDIDSFTNYSPTENLKDLFEIPTDKIIVSFIGRFSPEKGIFFLLDIIRLTLIQNDNLFFILSGSEEQIKFADVQNKIDEYKIDDKVKIINKVDDVRKIISITDIGILSSRYSEFICRIAMEFMSFKKPIVAPNVNVIPEVVGNDNTGFIYNLNDSTEASQHILELSNDLKLRKNMGINSFVRIQNYYDISVFDKKIKDILDLNK